MTESAIVVFSDPATGGDEALGRALNAMFLTLELAERGQSPALLFQGAGTRWPAALSAPDHPGHALYQAVRPHVAGICGACANVFGAAEGAAASGLTVRRDRSVAGVEGLLDLSAYLDADYRLIVF
jgi:hypothetical protein